MKQAVTGMKTAAQGLRDRARVRWWEWALLAVGAACWFFVPQQSLLFNEIMILALFAVSLDLILGYTGIVSLGHAAFFGLGAYVAALFAKFIHPDPLLGLVAAIVVSMLLGLVTSVLVMRGTDLTRLMVTLGVALILFELANKLDWLTGGADGLQGVVMGPLLGHFEFDLYGRVAFAYSLIVTIVCIVLLRRLVNSPFGVSLQAMRDNRLRAASIGLSVNARIAVIYTISAAVAGAAGGLLAQTSGFASLDVFDFHRSADVLMVLVIGGAGYLYGGIFGAIVYRMLHDLISTWTPQYWNFWIGLFLVVLVMVGRDRLLSPSRWVRRKPAAQPAGADTVKESHAS